MAIIANDSEQIEIGYNEKEELTALLRTSCYEGRQEVKMAMMILLATTAEHYEVIKADLLANQIGIGSAANPSYKEIWKDIKRKIKE